MKQCSKCGKIYPATLDYFYARKANKDGLTGWCRDCTLKEATKYRNNNKELINQKARERIQSTKYKEQKSKYDKTYYEQNKEKKSKYNHDFYLKQDKNKVREYQKEWNNNNKEYIKLRNKEYRERTKEERKAYDKQRYKKNRLSRLMSNAIGQSLKGKKNGQHWEDLVPYNLQQLKEHLEAQFTLEMNWSNYGSYWEEVDHIIPQNLFDCTSDEDFKVCWSLKNLRPLNKSKNRSRPKDGSDISKNVKEYILGQNV